jgi:hypothetical protein
MSILVSETPMYLHTNAAVKIGYPVEIIEKKYVKNNSVDFEKSENFIKGTLLSKTTNIKGVTTYVVISDNTRYEINSNESKYCFKKQTPTTHGGKRKTRHRKKSKIKTKTFRKKSNSDYK